MRVVLAVAAALGGTLLGALYLFREAVVRGDVGPATPELHDTPDGEPEWTARQRWEQVSIRSADGLILRGSYLAAPEATNRVAILAHGYRGYALRDMGEFAEFFHDRFGYNLLLPDARAHGASEGRYIGFGWPERRDWLRWIDLMIERHGPDVAIVLFGVSMGGATVMMTAGEELPPQVRCVIEDCGYTSAWDELAYQLRWRYHLPAFPLLTVASLISRLRAGYSFREASAVKQVGRATRPILFIHGGADEFVPTAMVYELHEACAAPKGLFVVPGAGHPMAIADDAAGYARVVGEFLDTWVPAEA